MSSVPELQHLWVQVAGLGAGVLIALGILVFRTQRHNPARIPFRLIAPKASLWALAFIAIYLLLAGVLHFLLLIAGTLSFLSPTTSPLRAFVTASFFGLVTPSVPELLTEPLSLREFKWFASMFRLLQLTSELNKFLIRLYRRKERELSFWLFENQARRNAALDRVFEFHSIEIARNWYSQKADNPKEKGVRENIFNLVYINVPAVKFKYLLRFLGPGEALKQLALVESDLSLLFPDCWPPDKCEPPGSCRRKTRPNESRAHHSSPPSRRGYEQPFIRSYIRGDYDTIR